MEAQQYSNNTPHSAAVATENNVTPISDTERNTDDEEEVLLKTEDEGSEEELQSPSPTMHHDTPPSHDIHHEEEVESAGDGFLCHPIRQQDGPEEVGPQEEDTCMSDEEEDCGTCSPEALLQETVERLKTVMETDRWRERQTGESEM